ncbi:MAG: hypothetical protein COU35_01545 [Candidatus Magasanikbacteria bacterium CG10_big_fil_rev_8_21_14_0_10_47_10]|uniref:Uncharacterized protein n=1 Tax=Candidatus Magasanikbacteria bacterium CG10_big_fil_rev_8_21_14_0_10_47_10 TaxID=1974652 RepID=A0A2H0TR46_9BACT|nr:MAG: hypothetical protein COU35_01545 [Candidatus Magasanikbacteria bacterium CG10_big_fil_rev_8_21_14_0_10_47_10]
MKEEKYVSPQERLGQLQSERARALAELILSRDSGDVKYTGGAENQTWEDVEKMEAEDQGKD